MAPSGHFLGRYRQVLALPSVGTLLVLMFAARIPITATSMVLTLHVVLTMHGSYGAAGLVGAAGTIGIAIGAPLMGRIVDAFGLRKMVVATTVGYGAYWLTAWLLPYPLLLALSFAGGLVSLPVMSVGRQALAALVPEDQRRTAYSLDSISVELSFMVGPAAAVLVATRVSTEAALISVGCLLVVAGAAVYAVNPPVRAAHEARPAGTPRPTRRQWLRPGLVAMLVIGCGTVFTLAGTEVAAIAALRGVGQVGFTGVVTIVLCAASVVGGIVYGALRRTPGPAVLLALLGLLLIPVGLVGGQWWVLSLALVPTSLMCAPTLAGIGDSVSRLAPAAVRGEAMGLHSSALTMGAAIGSPLIGFVVDRLGPGAGFAVAGAVGTGVAVAAWLAARRSRVSPGVARTAPVRGSSGVEVREQV